MAVAVMICYARSGGTVLNQCLGSLPHIVVLSEVNPLGGGSGKGPVSYRTVKSQASQWYGIEIKSDDFAEGILELHEICKARGLHLVVRDWPFVNFVPQPENGFTPPNRLLTLEALQGKCEIRVFAFVRDAIDVWLSRGTKANDFAIQYLRYVKMLLEHKIPIFKYEAFCRAPGTVLREICSYTGLDFNESYRRYEAFDRVNGDVQLLSRGIQQHSIRPLRRKRIRTEKIQELNQCSSMIEANRLLGYPVAYAAVPCENLLIRVNRVSRRLLRMERLKQVASFARLGGSLFDCLKLAITGYARGHVLRSRNFLLVRKRLRWSRIIVRPELLHGMKVELDLGDLGHLVSFEEIIVGQGYDLGLVKFQPQVVIDCGAHIGLFSILAACVFPDATTFAFEPSPRNVKSIQRQIDLNKLKLNLIPAAVSAEAGTRWFQEGESNTGRLVADRGNGNDTYPVECVSLPQFIGKLNLQSLLLKMDIEGEEERLIPAVIAELPPQSAVFFETHRGMGSWSATAAQFQNLGFQTEIIRARNKYCDGFAIRK